jgi:hypothetical protein
MSTEKNAKISNNKKIKWNDNTFTDYLEESADRDTLNQNSNNSNEDANLIFNKN